MSSKQDVERFAELAELKSRIEEEQADIKARLAEELQMGSHAIAGLTVTISTPARRFNLAKAEKFLTPDVIELCTVTSLDAKKVKSFLSPVLLDQSMDAGTGNPVVRIS